mmetsp:Transcript_5824/g.16322  ORF Transcript_5824/g.16322 Transcript_5824/m.16322 type:complete len:240 (-) Transcript_5824:995-1714(-)
MFQSHLDLFKRSYRKLAKKDKECLRLWAARGLFNLPVYNPNASSLEQTIRQEPTPDETANESTASTPLRRQIFKQEDNHIAQPVAARNPQTSSGDDSRYKKKRAALRVSRTPPKRRKHMRRAEQDDLFELVEEKKLWELLKRLGAGSTTTRDCVDIAFFAMAWIIKHFKTSKKYWSFLPSMAYVAKLNEEDLAHLTREVCCLGFEDSVVEDYCNSLKASTISRRTISQFSMAMSRLQQS